jgi:hypothetical protein
MFETICDLIPRDPALPARARRLDILKRVLNGTLYDALPYQFHEERNAAGEYIPLRNRRPSVRYPLARMVVEDSVALLFSEGHFPTIDSPDRDTRAAFTALARDCRLNAVMIEAAIRGSIGSSAILLRILRNRVFLDVLDTTWLTPEWDPAAPDTLLRVTERYKVAGRDLVEQGYDIDEPALDYWFSRCWDGSDETWFLPTPGQDPPLVDQSRSVHHGLGLVPLVWIRNLPGGDSTDGACTFRAAVETAIEIDYQLSQAGRGLKYSSDPTLVIKEPTGTEGAIIKGAGNALVLSEKGDAQLLEIGGTAAAAVIDYVRVLREYALESVHGNRAAADRLAAAQSGRALELLNQGLVCLADNLRVSYGEGALLDLARMIQRASEKYRLQLRHGQLPAISQTAALSLVWPRWYPPDSADRQRDAQTLATLAGAGLISRETAVKSIAATYDIEDVPAELAHIGREQAMGALDQHISGDGVNEDKQEKP